MTEACCHTGRLPSGEDGLVCRDLERCECLKETNGRPGGQGTSCDSYNCRTGACCRYSIFDNVEDTYTGCAQTTSWNNCAQDFLGIWYGIGSTCNELDAECSKTVDVDPIRIPGGKTYPNRFRPRTACCMPDGSCKLFSQVECLDANNMGICFRPAGGFSGVSNSVATPCIGPNTPCDYSNTYGHQIIERLEQDGTPHYFPNYNPDCFGNGQQVFECDAGDIDDFGDPTGFTDCRIQACCDPLSGSCIDKFPDDCCKSFGILGGHGVLCDSDPCVPIDPPGCREPQEDALPEAGMTHTGDPCAQAYMVPYVRPPELYPEPGDPDYEGFVPGMVEFRTTTPIRSKPLTTDDSNNHAEPCSYHIGRVTMDNGRPQVAYCVTHEHGDTRYTLADMHYTSNTDDPRNDPGCYALGAHRTPPWLEVHYDSQEWFCEGIPR